MRYRLLVGGVLLLLLVLSVEAYLATGGVSERARGYIAQQSEAALGAPVQVGSVHVSILPPRVRLEGVVLPQMGDWLERGTVKTVKVRLSLLSLLTGGIRALDITLVRPHLRLRLPESDGVSPGGDGPVTVPVLPWGAWATHRLHFVEGLVQVRRGDQVFDIESVELTAQPNVTLRSYNINLSNRMLSLDGRALLDSMALDLTLHPDRLRVRSAQLVGPAGQISLSGNIRAETPAGAGHDRTLALGLKTRYDGRLEGVLEMAHRLGINAPEVAGDVHLSGRLHGAPDAIHWDGEVNGEEISLPGAPRMLDTVDMRVRVRPAEVELVYSKLSVGGGELRTTGHLQRTDPPAYDLRMRVDDVGVGWLMGDDGPFGTISGEAHLLGEAWSRPTGTVGWRFRNDHPVADHPDQLHAPLWQRVAMKVAHGHGEATLSVDGVQHHQITVATPLSHVTARVEVAPDQSLSGEITAHSEDFADLGLLIGLDYVHGQADAGGSLSGTVKAFELAATGTLGNGRIRELEVTRLTGDVVVTPKQLVFRHVEMEGNGHIRMNGVLGFPPRGHKKDGLSVRMGANIKGVDLTPLAGLFYRDGGLELDLPVSGKVNVLLRPGKLAVWSRIRAGSGVLYEQDIHAVLARMWIDGERLHLGNAHVEIKHGDIISGADGEGLLRWRDGSYQVRLVGTRIPLGGVNFLAENVPFLSGLFAGELALTGDFEDPLLMADGAVRNFRFYDTPVGRGRLSMALSHWQLRMTAELAGPGVGDANLAARMVFYNRVRGDGPFALAVRMTDGDAVPWLRGLLPEVDLLMREQLGDDYGLSLSGRVSASGTIDDGPEILRMALKSATLASGPLTARAEKGGGLRLRQDVVHIDPIHLAGTDLDLRLSGSVTPERRYDVQVTGVVGSRWLDHLRPDYGVVGGESAVDVAITGEWDEPWVEGAVQPRGLMVAPPEMADVDGVITVTGDVALSGPLEDPGLGDMQGRFSPMILTVMGNSLRAPNVQMVGEDGVYTVPPVEFSGPMGQLRIDGGWVYPESVSLSGIGTLRLADMVSQTPGLSGGSGDVRVTGELSGSWDDPGITGGAELENARVRLDGLQQVLEIDSASMLLTHDRLVLDHLDGKLGGGPLQAQGNYQLDDDNVQLVVTLDNYHSRPFSGFAATLSGELALTGALPAPTLSGELFIHRALYDRRMQWGAWLMDAISESQQEVAKVVPFGDTRLALRVFGNNNILIDNNLAKLTLEVDVLATGTLADPGLVGRLDVRSGEIEFREHVFTLDSAGIDFIHPDRISPYVDVLAHTTVEHTLPNDPLRTEPVEVSLSLAGPPDQLDLTLSSQPDLPQNDLLSLLAVGRTTDELAGGGVVGAGEATYLVTGKLQSRLEEQVHRFTGLDRFQVDPFYTESTSSSTGSSTARITVGKRLFDGRGRVTYSTVVDATQEPLITFSYRLGPRITLLMEQDEEGRAGGEVRYRIRFR